jgi:ketosteroid isomerase-like protein
MKIRLSILLLAILPAITACSPTPHGADDAPAAEVTPTAPESSAPTELDTGAIGLIRDRYVAAVNDGDLDALMALWDDEGVLSPPGQARVDGKAAIQEWYQGMFRQSDADVDITSDQSRIAGDWAYDRGTFTLKLSPKSPSPSPQGSTAPATGPATAEVSGAPAQTFNYVVILRRQGGGDWKVTQNIWNPASAPAAAPTPDPGR